MQRLSRSTLESASHGVAVPAYDLDATGIGILHLGIGAFHRAHQAVFTQAAMNNSGGDWCIAGVSLRSDAVARQLRPQDCLYSVLSEDAREHTLQVIGAVREVLVVPQDMPRVLALIADPAVQIISLTITEKGYCSTDRGELDTSHPGIVADLAQPDQPGTAIGILALGLARRQAAGGAPVTVLSCDNLSENGRVLERVLQQYVQKTAPGLLPWMERHASFPSSMVDRIVPAIAPGRRERQCRLLGLDDASAIATEPFMQWIVEDNFAAARPDWASAGVMFVDDIRPYESIKLGLLNASHSAIACCGLIAGLDRVDEVVADPGLGAFLRELMEDELMPGLHAPVGFDLDAYREQLLLRFANPKLQHRCSQIFIDSSVKISQRWLPHLRRPGKLDRLSLALAGWCHLVLDTEIELNDPMQDQLVSLRRNRGTASIAELLALAHIGPDTVHDFPALCRTVARFTGLIREHGIRFCVEALDNN